MDNKTIYEAIRKATEEQFNSYFESWIDEKIEERKEELLEGFYFTGLELDEIFGDGDQYCIDNFNQITGAEITEEYLDSIDWDGCKFDEDYEDEYYKYMDYFAGVVAEEELSEELFSRKEDFIQMYTNEFIKWNGMKFLNEFIRDIDDKDFPDVDYDDLDYIEELPQKIRFELVLLKLNREDVCNCLDEEELYENKEIKKLVNFLIKRLGTNELLKLLIKAQKEMLDYLPFGENLNPEVRTRLIYDLNIIIDIKEALHDDILDDDIIQYIGCYLDFVVHK